MSRASISNPNQRIDLTDRQEDVIRLVARGLTNAEIAEKLGVTLDGVKWHVREILGKFGVESREEAADFWREQRGLARRARMWGAGMLASTAVRWAGGLAVLGCAGIAGAAVVVNSLQAKDEPEQSKAPAAVMVTPDPATNDGLTLKIEKVEADDTQTVVEFTLEGRDELGRISQPPQGILLDAATGRIRGKPFKATDQDGNEVQMRSWGADPANQRRIILTLDPLAPTAISLTLEMEGMPFVAPALETSEGERPPSPSAVINGPWLATIVEISRVAVASVPVDHTPLTFGAGSIVIDDVLQTASDTVVRLHLVDWPEFHSRWFYPKAALVDLAGATVEMMGARWGDGPDDERIEFRFPRVTGTMTLTLQGLPGHVLSESDIQANVRGQNLAPDREAALREHVRVEAAGAALVATFFEGQPPASWTFTLP